MSEKEIEQIRNIVAEEINKRLQRPTTPASPATNDSPKTREVHPDPKQTVETISPAY